MTLANKVTFLFRSHLSGMISETLLTGEKVGPPMWE